MDTKNIKNLKFLKREKNFKKESIWLDINMYWRGAICFILLSTLFSLTFGYIFFMKNSQDISNSSNVTSEQVETISKDRINNVLNIFSVRQQTTEKIINSPAPVVDPSH
jgi:Tfp pilus assembly protein PilO